MNAVQAGPGTAARWWPRAAAPALVMALAALAGCGSSPATRYYTLQATAPAATAAMAAASTVPPLRVRSVQVPPALDRLELVQEVAPGQIDIREFDHWAAPLSRLARQTLAEDLAARLPKDRLVFPGASWPDGAADLAVDVLSFRLADGKAVMRLSWTIRWPAPAGATAPAAPPPPPPPPPKGMQVRLETVAGNDAAAVAQAWSELLGQLADQVAAEWKRLAAR